MYNNLENLLEMIETKHEIDMLIENAIDNMSTRELEMLTEKGLLARAIGGGKKLVGLAPNASDLNAGRKAGWKAMNATNKTSGKAVSSARKGAIAAGMAGRQKVAGTAGILAGAGLTGATTYSAGKSTGTKQGQKQGVNAGIRVGAELARREILAQIKAETDAKRKASLINKAKNLFGMGE